MRPVYLLYSTPVWVTGLICASAARFTTTLSTQLRDDINFSEGERDKFRNRFEIKDFYQEGQTDSGLYLKIGEQILAWGMVEYLRVTDLINTEDQYTFGQQDLEDIQPWS